MNLSFNQQLKKACQEKNNYLCIGLDIDPEKFSKGKVRTLDAMETFGKEIIDGTINFCPAYKPNFAFYERFGSQGYAVLERLVDYIDGKAIVIADAKRGDIGNTSRQYARSILETMGCNAITISPYMGRDAIEPFIENPEKGVFVLVVTSNIGAREIQEHGGNVDPLYKKVIQMADELNYADNTGLVVGATQTDVMEDIRKLSKEIPWLIPGVGSQGGDLEKALNTSHDKGMAIINISREILYAGDGSINAVIQAARDYTNKIRGIVCNPVNC
mgnify:CR=1 FL=1